MEDAKNTQSAEAPNTAELPAKKVRMKEVEVLRPFRIGDTIYDRVGQVVKVPETEVEWLTQKITGQASAPFGGTYMEDDRHVLQRARLVA